MVAPMAIARETAMTAAPVAIHFFFLIVEVTAGAIVDAASSSVFSFTVLVLVVITSPMWKHSFGGMWKHSMPSSSSAEKSFIILMLKVKK
jgi:hypothetical protein